MLSEENNAIKNSNDYSDISSEISDEESEYSKDLRMSNGHHCSHCYETNYQLFNDEIKKTVQELSDHLKRKEDLIYGSFMNIENLLSKIENHLFKQFNSSQLTKQLINRDIKNEIRSFTNQLIEKENLMCKSFIKMENSLSQINISLKSKSIDNSIENVKPLNTISNSARSSTFKPIVRSTQIESSTIESSTIESSNVGSSTIVTANNLTTLNSNRDYKKFKDLPIPQLTLERKRDYDKWFNLYEKVMNTKDQEILKWCLSYYLDDDIRDLFIEISGKKYKNIKRSLYDEIASNYPEYFE